ncbi:MAG TPA: TonB-dependent receptor plug domain-containing protein, partial [Rhizomicrobium sp.]
MRRSFLLFVFSFAAVSCLQARADDLAENIIVTATRTPQPAEKTGESVSLITSQQLDQRQILTVTDALQQTPGITVVHPGGLGQSATTVSIRGAEVGQTLVLIDGVRLNDPGTVDNEPVMGDLLVNDIDRIEVVRGPQSTLYGSDAIGGVVNIFSRRGGETPIALRASAEAGSFDTYHFNAAANGTVSDVEYGAAANFLHSNGTSAADSHNGNPETDGYTNAGLTENVRVHLGDGASIDLRSYYTNARVDFDDNFAFVPPDTFRVADSAAYARDSLLGTYLGFNFGLLGGAFSNRIAAIGSDAKRAYYDSAFDTVHKNSSDDGGTRRLEYQGTLQLMQEDQLTFGAEYQRVAFTGKVFSSFATESIDRGRSHV